MNFKSEIDQAYAELSMIPINGQDLIVDEILTEFFINNKKNVIVSADTGIGKSIIGAVVARVFANRFDWDNEENDKCPATIAVHSNSLVKQYRETFSKFGSDMFHQIIGANNYACPAAEATMAVTKEVTINAELCFKSKAEPHIVSEYCDNCEYNIARQHINTTDALITNYSYYMLTSMNQKGVKPRVITIFDEAHTINDVFCNHTSITVSMSNLQKMIDECKDTALMDTREYTKVLSTIKDKIGRKEIREDNFVADIKNLRDALSKIKVVYDKLAKEEIDPAEYVKLNKIGSKFSSMSSKISDLFIHKYDHVFDDSVADEISIKPIFVSSMSKMIMSEYNLFMSATISDRYMHLTMNLTPLDTAFIKLDPVYDPENKSVVFCGTNRLNAKTMKDPSTIEELKSLVKDITMNAAEDGYKGLMLTPSFDVGEMLSKSVDKSTRVFLHRRGMKVDAMVKEFKEYTAGPAILISPSIYEGLDFANDLSRYQIIVKSPFASLGDKRIAYIAKNYPDVYQIMTIKKIVQGIGRSVRNKDDWCVTFVLDKSAEQLFMSPLNVWKNQFSI